MYDKNLSRALSIGDFLYLVVEDAHASYRRYYCYKALNLYAEPFDPKKSMYEALHAFGTPCVQVSFPDGFPYHYWQQKVIEALDSLYGSGIVTLRIRPVWKAKPVSPEAPPPANNANGAGTSHAAPSTEGSTEPEEPPTPETGPPTHVAIEITLTEDGLVLVDNDAGNFESEIIKMKKRVLQVLKQRLILEY